MVSFPNLMWTHDIILLFSYSFYRLSITGSVYFKFVAGTEKAMEYFNQMEPIYPSLCSRLELGYSWEDAAEKIIFGCQ